MASISLLSRCFDWLGARRSQIVACLGSVIRNFWMRIMFTRMVSVNAPGSNHQQIYLSGCVTLPTLGLFWEWRKQRDIYTHCLLHSSISIYLYYIRMLPICNKPDIVMKCMSQLSWSECLGLFYWSVIVMLLSDNIDTGQTSKDGAVTELFQSCEKPNKDRILRDKRDRIEESGHGLPTT